MKSIGTGADRQPVTVCVRREVRLVHASVLSREPGVAMAAAAFSQRIESEQASEQRCGSSQDPIDERIASKQLALFVRQTHAYFASFVLFVIGSRRQDRLGGVKIQLTDCDTLSLVSATTESEIRRSSAAICTTFAAHERETKDQTKACLLRIRPLASVSQSVTTRGSRQEVLRK